MGSGMYPVLQKNKGLVLFEGVICMLLGIWALLTPFLFAVVYDICIGAILCAAGLTQLFRTGKIWGSQGAWVSLLWSILTIVCGAFLLVRPLQGIVALTTLMAVFFMLEGIFKFSWAFAFESSQKWWMFLSAIISIFLSALIFAGLPWNATWVLGLFIGIDLIFYSMFFFSFYSFLKKDQA